MTIKPLEWIDVGDKTSAVCILGVYWFDAVGMHRNGPKLLDDGYHFGVWTVYEGTDRDAAKAAAQADFDALIASVLVDDSDKVRSAFADCVVMTDDCRMIIGFETPDKCTAAALTLSEVVG